jgi:ribosomal subunit interface protein
MEIIFKGRQTDVPARFREYATAKLNKLEKLDQKAIRVDVEVSVERNPRLASQKERVELTIRSRGPAIRAEAAAEDRMSALDLALAKLNSRLRRALDRRKNHHGAGISAVAASGVAASAEVPEQATGGGLSSTRTTASSAGTLPAGQSGAAAAGVSAGELAADQGSDRRGRERPRAPERGPKPDVDAGPDSVVAIQMEGDGPLVVRQKFHHAKPISIDQALLEMELVGHDFYLFHDVEEDAPSVVYRRHGYQYGVIRLIEESAGRRPATESPAGLGARIPGRRRPELGRTRSRRASAAEAATPAPQATAISAQDFQVGRQSGRRPSQSPAFGTGWS